MVRRGKKNIIHIEQFQLYEIGENPPRDGKNTLPDNTSQK